MYSFIQTYWNTSNKIIFYKNGREVRLDLFVPILKLDVESFKSRIKFISDNTREIRISKDHYQEYPALKPLVDYIFNSSEEGSENRKAFIKYVTGTEYSPAEILIKLTDNTMRPDLYRGLPFYAHTCSNTVDLFRKPENFEEVITEEVINAQLKATTSHNSNVRAAEI